MFTRSESFSQFLKLYPITSIFTGICLVLYAITSLPFMPGIELYTLFSGVNLYISEGELWRLVTPIFIHANFPHLLFNGFTLIIIGPALETMMGKGRYFLLFMLSGILANVLTYLAMPLQYVHVGASGALFGLFGCYAFILLYRKGLLTKENAQIIFILITIGVVMTFLQKSINIMGHIGGLLSGLALSAFLFPKKNPYR